MKFYELVIKIYFALLTSSRVNSRISCSVIKPTDDLSTLLSLGCACGEWGHRRLLRQVAKGRRGCPPTPPHPSCHRSLVHVRIRPQSVKRVNHARAGPRTQTATYARKAYFLAPSRPFGFWT